MNADVFQVWLSEHTQRPIRMVITENRSLMLSFKAQPDGMLVVRAHRMFLDAPAEVKQALAKVRATVDPSKASVETIVREALLVLG